MIVKQNTTTKQRIFLVSIIKHDFTTKSITILDANTGGKAYADQRIYWG